MAYPWLTLARSSVGEEIGPCGIVVDGLKDAFMGAGFCHFPVGRGHYYYADLTSERPLRKYQQGVARRVWTKAQGARNEPLDCRILAMAALEGLKASGLRLTRLSALKDRPKRRRTMSEWFAVFNG